MTSPVIPRQPFDHPAAWTAADLDSKDTIAFDLADRHIAAFETALAGLRERGPTTFEDIGRGDFPLDDIADDVRDWRHEIDGGRGLLLLREFPIDRWSREDTELVWFGPSAPISAARCPRAHSATCSGTWSTSAGMTCATVPTATHGSSACTPTRCDTIGMFCLRRAKSGGESGYSSALAVHDRIRELKPELLESLWAGFHLHRFGEQPPGEPPYTPVRIPVFSECGGVTTVVLIGGYAWMAADEYDAPYQ